MANHTGIFIRDFTAEYGLEEIKQAFSNIPQTHTQIEIFGNFYEPRYIERDYSFKETLLNLPLAFTERLLVQLPTALAYLPKHITSSRIVTGLHGNIQALDIGYGILHGLQRQLYANFFRDVAAQLTSLNLSNNGLAHIDVELLALAFESIPPTLLHIDLSNNGILLLHEDLARTILSSLPVTIDSLTIYEYDMEGMSGAYLSRRLCLIPAHIHTICLRQCGFFGLTLHEFIKGLSKIPETITTLDLSDNELHQFHKKSLIKLFSSLPSSIKHLKLNQNNLCCLSKTTLKKVLRALHEKGIDVDLAENGFDRLSHTERNRLLDAVPDNMTVHFSDRSLSLRQDGMLIPMPNGRQREGIHPLKTIRHQQHFAKHRLVMMQLMRKNGLDLKMGCLILSYLMNESEQELERKYPHMKNRLITSVSPEKTTPKMHEACQKVVRRRIRALSPEDKTLDLSRCGLNRFNDPDWLKNKLENIPAQITHLNLRGNGLQAREVGRRAFIAAIGKLSKHVSSIDLSENGFELCDYHQLTEVLAPLPNTVLFVTIGNEKPLSPAEQLARRRQWPKSYTALTAPAEAMMQKAQRLLLDYTKDNSLFRRMMTGHWNRNHIKSIEKILFLISVHKITNISDLMTELEQVPVPHYAGSFARRLSFLYHSHEKTVLAERLAIGQNAMEQDNAGIELRPMR